MFVQLKSIFNLMGQRLAEMLLTVDKMAKIEKRAHHYRLSGGRSRIVLIASTDLMGTAFDFAVELANNTNSLIEVLYFKPEEEIQIPLRTLLNKLGDLTHDFKITFVTGNLRKIITTYRKQHQDTVAVICSASEVFIEELRPAPLNFNCIMDFNFSNVLIIDEGFLA